MPGPSRLPDLPLWEARWTQAALEAKRQEDGRMFARGFRLVPFSDEERAFPSFRKCFSYGVSVGDLARGPWPKFLGVDLAGDERPGNALVAVAVDPSNRRRHVLKCLRGAWTSPETAQRIISLDQEYNFRVIVVETNAYQKALVDWLRQMKAPCWFKVRATVTGKNKVDPALGVRSLEVEFSNLSWVVPAGEFESHPPSCACGWCAWRREMEDYPMGAADDFVMSTWFCRQAIDLYAAPGGPTRIEGLHDR
jgi:hypothetical protein